MRKYGEFINESEVPRPKRQLASVAGSSIIQFGDIGVYYRKIRQGELSFSLTNAKRQ
jgi:hypothetical protein